MPQYIRYLSQLSCQPSRIPLAKAKRAHIPRRGNRSTHRHRLPRSLSRTHKTLGPILSLRPLTRTHTKPLAVRERVHRAVVPIIVNRRQTLPCLSNRIGLPARQGAQLHDIALLPEAAGGGGAVKLPEGAGGLVDLED
jgi:hypothetical protein